MLSCHDAGGVAAAAECWKCRQSGHRGVDCPAGTYFTRPAEKLGPRDRGYGLSLS